MIFEIEEGVLIKATPEPNCDNKRIIIPSGIKEIGPGAFMGCKDIEQICLPDGLRKIAENAFTYCRNLTSITVPEGVTHILHGAFAYSGLTSIILPDSLEIIGTKAFTNSHLQVVKIPGSVKQIEYGAFSYCGNLRTVEVGQGVNLIDRKAFFGCVSLRKVELPESIDYIDESAFEASDYKVFYVKKASYAYSFARQNRIRVLSDKDAEDQISRDLLLRCLERNYLHEPVNPDQKYPITLLNELPVHFYCLVDNESVGRIHSKGLYIPSLFEQHKSEGMWIDGYFFSEKRMMPFGNDLVRIKISLRHKPEYINDTTGEKQVRVLKFKDCFLFCDAVHLYPEQCYFLDPYICSKDDTQFGIVQLSAHGKWNNICHLIIPNGFTKLNDCACSDAQNLESVYIGDTVSYIGNDSFCNCPKLTSVYIGGSVDASYTRAFRNCPELRSVTMSAHLKSVIFSRQAMCRQSAWPWFVDCPQLKWIRFDDGSFIPI